MLESEIYQTLMHIDFFRDFTRDDIDRLLQVGQWLRVSSGQIIISEGSEHDLDLFVLVQGQVNVIKNKKMLAVLNPGDCFGEISALARTPRTAHVIAKQECYCVRFQPHRLESLPTELQLKLFKKMLYSLAGRLISINRRYCTT
jgi:CRP-like cAMP-binding protein